MTEATAGLVTTGNAPTVIVKANGAPAPEVLEARRVTAETPAAEAVPLIWPLPVLSSKPAGSPEAS